METPSINILPSKQEKVNPENRSVCVKIIPSSARICGLETRPRECRDRRITDELVNSTSSVCISPILPHKQGSEQSAQRTGASTYVSDTNLAITSVVSKASSNVHSKTTSLAQTFKTASKPTGRSSSPSEKQNPQSSALDDFRSKLQNKGISGTAANLITSCRRQSTLSNYNSSWNQWASWCRERHFDPFRAGLNRILDYLAYLFDLGREYRTVNCHSSAISAYPEKIDGKPAGQHPDICALVKGVFNTNPPKPRYVFIWDVQIVLDFMKKNWGDTKSLSHKFLTFKLVMLMALTSASRAGALHLLDIRFRTETTKCTTFVFHKLHKGWKRGQAPPKLDFYAFPNDPELCVVSTLNIYIERSKPWRNSTKTQLLLGTIEPHDQVTSDSVSRWLKNVLHLAGIDTNTFKGHSTGSASSSRAGMAGMSVEDIMKRGSWSNESTWQRFYNKPVLSAEEKFQNSVLCPVKKL